MLANNKPRLINKNKPRRLDCIYLQDIDSFQGGHNILHLQTNSVITCNCVTPAPITPTIINQLRSIADSNGMPSGIKIDNITGLILYDSALIARVYYSEGDDNEN